MISAQLLPGAIYHIMASATDTGRLTQADRYGMMAAILDESLTEDEQRSINRLLRSVVRGRVQIADELSEVL
ncbi:MAG: hypothetical protein ACP5D7_12630 [Limnospira sp.]